MFLVIYTKQTLTISYHANHLIAILSIDLFDAKTYFVILFLGKLISNI